MSRKAKPSPLESDPIVDEVRRARASLWRKGGGTPEGFSRATAGAGRKPGARRKSKPKGRKAA